LDNTEPGNTGPDNTVSGNTAFSNTRFDNAEAVRRLREALPAALVPLLAVVEALPPRPSGKWYRAALPWPLPGLDPSRGTGAGPGPAADLSETEAWLAELWGELLGLPPSAASEDFFASGGG